MYNKILTMKNTARKEKWESYKIVLLGLIQGEVETAAKRTGDKVISDRSVIKTIKKIIESNCDSIAAKDNDILKAENVFLQSLLPLEKEKMTELQIKDHVFQSGTKSVGDFMKYMESRFSGQYDRAISSKIAREILK